MFGLISQAGKEEEQKIDESTPWMAAGDGDLKLLQRALSTLGLNAGAQDHNGYSLAHAASSYGHVEVLKWLVTQSECDVNVKDSDGDSPLHYCDSVDIAKCLCAHGAEVHVKNNDGLTPLQVKENELKELSVDDEDDDSDDESEQNLKELINFLSSFSSSQQMSDD